MGLTTGLGGFPDRFGLGGVGMNNLCQGVQSDARDNRQRQVVDHFASVARHDGCPQDGVGAFAHMDFHEAFFAAVGDGAVDLVHR